MELRSLQSPAVSSILRGELIEKPFVVCDHTIKLPGFKRHSYPPHHTKLQRLYLKVQALGSNKTSSKAVEEVARDTDLKDEDLVFVAGATGRVGSRTVRELLKLGFHVRAGVRSAQRAESLVQSVRQMKLDEVAGAGLQRKRRDVFSLPHMLYSPAIGKLEVVECDLERKEQIGPALGNPSVVICCIGASEKEIFDITGPCRIDYLATKNLIDAATAVKVNHFILLTSLGTNKVGFPAAILNLFWGVLIWKRKAEETLLASGLPYTIVRPGGMERPTDSYKETHNITLSQEDTLFGGQVSNLQVAELMAFMAKNRNISYCKVVEVIAETTAPLTPFAELLTRIPSQRVDPYPSKESAAADGPVPAASENISSETLGSSIEKKPAQLKAAVTRPLSPYTAYEDLKPPSSPAPTPSTSAGATIASKIDEVPVATNSVPSSITVNSSPYPNYVDLKPPTSPTPTAPINVKEDGAQAVLRPDVVNVEAGKISSIPAGIAESETASIGVEKTRPLSPYTAYEDLKPPSSPSPTPSGTKKTA